MSSMKVTMNHSRNLSNDHGYKNPMTYYLLNAKEDRSENLDFSLRITQVVSSMIANCFYYIQIWF